MAMSGGTAKLVAKGTPNGWPGPISLYAYYKVVSQDIESSKTVLALGMYITTPSSWSFGEWYDYYGSYIGTATSGTDCKSFDGTCPAGTTGTKWLVENAQVTVTHNADGTKKATIYWKWGAASSWAGFSAPASGSFTVDLPTIPKAATLEALSCATSYLTGNLTYKYTPKSSAYYNRCSITLNIDGTLSAVKTINIGKKGAAQQTGTVTLSASELSTIYNKLPSATKGTLRFTLRTFSDADYSKMVGSEVYKEITLSIPNDSTTQAAVTMALEAVSSLASAFAGLYIQGKTKVKATLSATGKYGAQIKSYSMKVSGDTYDSDDSYTSDFLSTPGTIKVYGYAKDSRGFTGSTSQNITVHAYSEPQLLPASGESEVVADRCDANGNLTDNGTYLRIKAKRSYSPVMVDGVQKNFCRIRYRYRLAGTTAWSAFVNILPRDNLDSDEIDTGALLGGALAADSTYQVQVQAIDDILGQSYTQINVPTDKVHNHKTKNGWGMGKYCEGENLLDVGWDAHFHGSVKIGDKTLKEYILAVISEGG